MDEVKHLEVACARFLPASIAAVGAPKRIKDIGSKVVILFWQILEHSGGEPREAVVAASALWLPGETIP
jgi:hypothetical protein